MHEQDLLIHLGKHDMKRARSALKGLRGSVDRTRFLYLEGLYLKEKGDLEEALKRFDMALVLHLSDPELWMAKASALEDLGKIEMAKRAADRACRLDPGNARAHLILGRILFTMKDYRGALPEIDSSIELDGHDVISLTLRGIIISILEEDYIGALSFFDRAIQEDEGYPKAWSNRGVALRQIGDRTGAVYSFQKCLLLDGGNETSRRMLISLGEQRLVDDVDGERARQEEASRKKRTRAKKRTHKKKKGAPSIVWE